MRMLRLCDVARDVVKSQEIGKWNVGLKVVKVNDVNCGIWY